MFQSPENSVSQDEAHPSGKSIAKPFRSTCGECFCRLMAVSFPSSESLAEPLTLETPTHPGVTDTSPLISFSLNPTSSSPCSHTTAAMKAPPQLSQSSSSQALAPVTATVPSTQPPPFLQITGPQQQISDVPAQAPVQAPNQLTPQHYVALSSTFLQPSTVTQTTPLPPSITAPPSVAPALTSTASGTTTAGPVGAGTTTDALAAAAQPVPLVNNPVPISGPGLGSSPATIAIAPTQNLLQPSLVMSDQNLQWILSSAANGQQNPEQAVSGTHYTHTQYLVP